MFDITFTAIHEMTTVCSAKFYAMFNVRPRYAIYLHFQGSKQLFLVVTGDIMFIVMDEMAAVTNTGQSFML